MSAGTTTALNGSGEGPASRRAAASRAAEAAPPRGNVPRNWLNRSGRHDATLHGRRERRAAGWWNIAKRFSPFPIFFGIALFIGAASVSHAARIQAQTDDLRQLITLPPMHFTVNVVASRGQLRWRQDLGTPEEIAKLQKELRGDSTDAQQLLQLGRLFEDAGRTNQAALAYSNAVTAFRQQVENQPKDGKLLAGLGEALANISQRLEAETVLRRAVTVSPRDRACWTQLGLFLSDSSHFVLYPEKTPQDLMESPALLATKYKPSAAQFERAEKLSRESMECFDRAISLAPKDALGFQARACGLSTVAFLRTLKQQLTAPDPERLTLSVMYAMLPFTPECLPDLRRAAELDPENPELLAAVAFAEVMSARMSQALKRGASDASPDKAWDILSADQAKSVHGKMDRLTKLMELPSKEKAASAAMFLGLLQLVVVEDELGAEVSLRRAVTLNPSNQKAQEALLLTFATEERYEKMAEAGEAMVKAIDTSRSHLCLAKAYEKLNRWDKVTEEAQAAVKAAPDDITAKLALACALLRLNDENLEHASAGLLESGNVDIKQAEADLRVHGLFFCGLYMALEGQADQARPFLEQALHLQPDHEGAKKALAIIDSWK